MTGSIYSVNRMSERWPFAHVREKGHKRPLPSLADTNTASAVVLATNVVTAVFHGDPRAIGRAAVMSMFRARDVSVSGDFSLQASTTTNHTATQMDAVDNGYLAAVTTTEIRGFAIPEFVKTDHSQTSKSPRGLFEVSRLCHD